MTETLKKRLERLEVSAQSVQKERHVELASGLKISLVHSGAIVVYDGKTMSSDEGVERVREHLPGLGCVICLPDNYRD